MMRAAIRPVTWVLAIAIVLTAAAVGDADYEPFGYRIEGDTVVFRFDHLRYESVSRGDTGRRMLMEQVMPDDGSVVAVAGEFNGWSTDAWVMECMEPGVYELRRPLADFGGAGQWAFKFVIDGILWVEPPRAAPNAVPTGFSNLSYNLLLVVDGPETGRASAEAASTEVSPEAPAPSAGQAPSLEKVESPLLQALIPSEDALGGVCAPKRIDAALGATPIPVDSNPMITADRRVVGFISVFVMPPTVEEEAQWETEALNESPGGFMTRVEELMAERTANVRAALVAIYESASTGSETGVFALEFTEALSPERQEALAVEGSGGAVITSDHVAAAVWTDDRDPGCIEIVRAHVEAALADQ